MGEFYLKILSGNHQGAEIPLEPGRYTLGKGENCDLILTDATLQDLELSIEISEQGALQVTSEASDIPLYLNGQPGQSNAQPNHFDIITSSGLFFALGPADTDWPDLALPELNRPAPPPQEEPAASDEEGVPGDDFFPSTEDDELIPTLENDDPESSDKEEQDDSDEEDDEDFVNPLANIDRRWLIAIPGALAAFILVIAVLLFSEPEAVIEREKTVKSYLDQAKEARIELNQKNVKLKELPDKSILITGYSNTQKERQALLQNFQEQGIPYSSQLVVMNELRANADALLKNIGYQSLSLELDNTPGSLVLTGYVPTSEELTQIMTTLKQEIHGLVSIVDQVENQAGRVNTLKSMLREKSLSPRIHLIQKPNQIILEGHLLDEEQVYNLNDVVSRFRKRYGNRPALRTATRTAVSPQNPDSNNTSPSLQIRGVSMGRVPYVVMEDGEKYLVGAKLVNGYIIEDINLEYLLLSNGTDRIKYRLGGNGGQKKTE